MEIAIAARIVMLSAASHTCSVAEPTEIQDKLLKLVDATTHPSHVEGRPFPGFLKSAVESFCDQAESQIVGADVGATVDAVAACEPRDVVGEMYEDLRQLVAKVYDEALGDPIEVPLVRNVLPEAPAERAFRVSGHVPPHRKYVTLNLYVRGFDLGALALLPRILAHELICHVGARHVGTWTQKPDPDCRAFFSDGFMDCAVWHLLMTWLEGDALSSITPVGHLTEVDVPYSFLRPHAFRAGRAAWSNCGTATNARLRDDSSFDPRTAAILRAAAENAVADTALHLNACDCSIERKDRFVHLAREPQPEVTECFAEVAVGQAVPLDLFGEVLGDDPDAGPELAGFR
ncbi:MAG TPA: hypothetical protein VI111_06490 [Thermoleophilaceae bacterium]